MWFHLYDKIGEKIQIVNGLIFQLHLGFASKMKFTGSHIGSVKSVHRLHQNIPQV